MNNIIIIGSGPVGLLTAFYLYKQYSNIKCYIISPNFKTFHCTYGLFIDQIKNTWIYKYFDKSKLFINTLNISLNFYSNNDLNLSNKYCIINNTYLFDTIMDFLKTTNIEFITGHVYDIIKESNKYNVLFQKNSFYYKNLYCDFVIQATGNQIIGQPHINDDLYYQYFVGYKIYVEDKHHFKTCILLNWNKVDNNETVKSFCYVLPYDNKNVLIEETILSTNKDENYYNILENRLKQRIKNYNLNKYYILEKEIYKIPLNKPIQNKDNYINSFKIGVCGNMINNLSGYTIGYNIYHIPEFCNYIIKGNYSHEYVINNFWNYKRLLINKINLLGLQLMESMTQEELSEFHYNYFKFIINTNNFKVMFLNNDTNISFVSIATSFISYIHFPKKFLYKIGKLLIRNFINKFIN